MFSFGIFTTHIPYIAFVAFYAYFLLFGVEKASKGEIQSESSFITELQIESTQYLINEQNNGYASNAFFFNASDFELFILKRKIRPPVNPPGKIHQAKFYTALSNRPPPIFG